MWPPKCTWYYGFFVVLRYGCVIAQNQCSLWHYRITQRRWEDKLKLFSYRQMLMWFIPLGLLWQYGGHAPTFNKWHKKKKNEDKNKKVTLDMLTHGAMRGCGLASWVVCIDDKFCDKRDRDVTTRSEIWITNIRSLGCRDIEMCETLWRLILRNLGCIGVFNTCQMPFSPSNFYFGHFTNMCSTKVLPFTVKASPKFACHKIQWLQFANRNIVGLQFWHSSNHFQIPMISCNFDSALTATSAWQAQLYVNVDFRTILGEEWSWESIETWNIGCTYASVIMRSFDGKYGLGSNFWHLEIDPNPEGSALGVGWWLSVLCRESK